MFSNLQDSLLKLKRCAEIPEFIWCNFFYKYFIKAEHRKNTDTINTKYKKQKVCVNSRTFFVILTAHRSIRNGEQQSRIQYIIYNLAEGTQAMVKWLLLRTRHNTYTRVPKLFFSMCQWFIGFYPDGSRLICALFTTEQWQLLRYSLTCIFNLLAVPLHYELLPILSAWSDA